MTDARPRSVRRAAWNADRRAGVDRAALAEGLAALESPAPDRRPGRGAQAARAAAAGPAPRAAPGPDPHRWVPIGPTVVRRGQASSSPGVAGRMLDVQVSSDGRRVYAAAADGGLWYSGDAATTWTPVGGWQELVREQGGPSNPLATSCLLVEFGATAADDHVVVGTGEFGQGDSGPYVPAVEGVGVLVARGPAARPATDPVWEPDQGLDALTALRIGKVLRHPGRRAGAVAAGGDAATPDVLVACTDFGPFVGTRVAATGTRPERYDWSPATMTAPTDAGTLVPHDTAGGDGVWVDDGTPHGRLLLCLDGWGPVWSADLGATYNVFWDLTPFSGFQGRTAIALVPGTFRAYVLGQLPSGETGIWRIPDVRGTNVSVERVPGLPDSVFGTRKHLQRDYDLAIAAEDLGGTDRLYVGGSGRTYTSAGLTGGNEWVASLWAYDVTAAPRLTAAAGVSTTAVGASSAGLIGHDVHADIHAIRSVHVPASGATAAQHQVWVACDGGIFVSVEAGRVNTFAARNGSLATLEPGYLDCHPVSPHFVAAGLQDNGSVVRIGDTVWEQVHEGDGGGIFFLPGRPEVIVAQYTNASWRSQHPRFVDPMQRRSREPGVLDDDGESKACEFYAGADAIAGGPGTTRVAIGTYRVWLCDNLTETTNPTWRVLPFPTGTAQDCRARPSAGADAVFLRARMRFGMPFIGPDASRTYTGRVRSVRWARPDRLVVAFSRGVARWTDLGGGQWAGEVWHVTNTTNLGDDMEITDVAPVPRTSDFYVTATMHRGITQDTLLYYEDATDSFHRTGMREVLPEPSPGRGHPLDPAYSVVVDPCDRQFVYVGTSTGVWRGRRTNAQGGHADWTRVTNGLPPSTAQDLSIWVDPARVVPTGPADEDPATARLLRAAIQSRGIWELNLAAEDPRHTYLRVHHFDDRRRVPTPLAHPHLVDRARTPIVLGPMDSPDVLVRPRWPLATAPAFPRLGSGSPSITRGSTGRSYDIWTFQTAFRWLHPQIAADGRFTDQFRETLKAHRGDGNGVIDRALWEAVVGGVHLDAQLNPVTGAAAVGLPLAVYRPPWHTAAAPSAPANEAQLLGFVQSAGAATLPHEAVYLEPSSVEILLHHRDPRPVAADQSWAMLLWQWCDDPATAAGLDVTAVPGFRRLASDGSTGHAAPNGWQVVTTGAGAARHTLGVPLSAHLPRAVTVDLDLTAPGAPTPTPRGVVLLALTGSLMDDQPVPEPAAPGTLADFVRDRWYAAARFLLVSPRPAYTP